VPRRADAREAASCDIYPRGGTRSDAQYRPAQDQFYGDRDGYIIDPFGHGWAVASHVEDVPRDEMARRIAELYRCWSSNFGVLGAPLTCPWILE
jgi:hypothetical protein